MKHLLPAAAVLVAGTLSGGCTVTVDSHSEIVREDRRFAVAGLPDVRVATFDGSIQIQSWDKPEVLVEIEKRGPTRQAIDALQVIATHKDNVVELEVKRPSAESFGGIGVYRAAYARLIVTVPRASNVSARSGDGSIRLEGVSGRIDLRTGDGSVRAADVSGDLTVDTGDGSVTVTRAEGKASIETSDGSVTVAGSLGQLKLHTGDGSVVYRADPGSKMTGNWEITTGDGAVALYLPPDFSAHLDAHTGDGRITNELHVEKETGDERARRSLRGKLGAGGQLLRVRTGDGSIRLKSN